MAVFNASLGNYNFEIFDVIEAWDLYNIGIFFTVIIVVIFNIIILNLIIAILANTYAIFDSKSIGLYLSKILMSRDEMAYD